jgi:hypothetical protein
LNDKMESGMPLRIEDYAIDFMPPRRDTPMLVRLVTGGRGRVDFQTELVIRFDYGGSVPLGLPLLLDTRRDPDPARFRLSG